VIRLRLCAFLFSLVLCFATSACFSRRRIALSLTLTLSLHCDPAAPAASEDAPADAKANPFASFGSAKAPPKANPFAAFAGAKPTPAFGGASLAAPAFGGTSAPPAFGGGGAPAFGGKALPQPGKGGSSPKLGGSRSSRKALGVGVVREAHLNRLNADFLDWLATHVKEQPAGDFSKNFEGYQNHAKARELAHCCVSLSPSLCLVLRLGTNTLPAGHCVREV